MPPLPNQRHEFEVPDDLVYFNTASLAPQLRVVRAAAEEAAARWAAPWTIKATDWFSDVERLRELFARLVGGDADGAALIPATSYGLALAAQNTEAGPGDKALVIAADYPSTVYTWRAWAERTGASVLTVERETGQSWTDAVLAAADESVRVISVPNVHWTDGSLIALDRVGERARELGAALVVDGTQSLGARPLDVAELRPDYLVAAGYKWLLGPLGVGYLYVAEQHRGGRPLEENWINRQGAEDFAGLTDYSDEYAQGARRFDVGQRSSFSLTPMAIAALTKLLEWGVENVAESLAQVTARIEAGARERGLEVAATADRCAHMLGIALRGDLGDRLAESGVFVGMRGSSMRVSPHLHATESDVERFFEVLDVALSA